MSSDTLNDCGCCQDGHAGTPEPLENPPGLSAITYRVGTQARFKQSMLKRLSKEPAGPALRKFTTREDDDPSIALLDAAATMLDSLTFYQERIVNEGFLRTASERRSILELARSIGYELRPGVAAGTHLAFTLETAPGSPLRAPIAIGTKVQSLPGPDERPQVFETVEAFEARPEWNSLKPQTSELHQPQFGDAELYLKGNSTNLKIGDAILIVGNERVKEPNSNQWDFRTVKEVESNTAKGWTRLAFDRPLGKVKPRGTPAQDDIVVFVLRLRTSLFGHNAPDWRAMPLATKKAYGNTTDDAAAIAIPDWPGLNSIPSNLIVLDAVYPQIVVDSWVVLSVPNYDELYKVEKTSEDARAEFTLTAKTTTLQVNGENLQEKFSTKVRSVAVYAQSEALELAERPLFTPIQGSAVTLSTLVEGLARGQVVIVTGKLAGAQKDDPVVSEVMFLANALAVKNKARTELTFTQSLVHTFDRETVSIQANVVKATHGETQREVLGSGHAANPFQRFGLKKHPLTFVSAATPSGGLTTLEVRVDDVRWSEVPSLYAQPAKAQVYTTRLADDGAVTVQFGDGLSGARLPSGTENVTGVYRAGTGLEGQVRAEQLSLLLTRPLGVKSVINPLAPTGAQNPEERDQARQNAPLTVLTLERVVSVRDYENFARAFSGIGKAQAITLGYGTARRVHLTVAAANGRPVEENSDLMKNLRSAILQAGDPHQAFVIDSFHPRTFDVTAHVLIDARYRPEPVTLAVRRALLETFSFERQAFGQVVTASQVIAAMQAVPGVIAVTQTALYETGQTPLQKRDRIDSHRASVGPYTRATLLTINPQGIQLTAALQANGVMS
jgi:predicted phage baseplate assembly protein